jgi:hypothetical protein
MNTLRKMPDAEEIRFRAAEIRKGWTPAEKERRTGLPPDTPERLRDFILGPATREWRTSPQDPQRSMRGVGRSAR